MQSQENQSKKPKQLIIVTETKRLKISPAQLNDVYWEKISKQKTGYMKHLPRVVADVWTFQYLLQCWYKNERISTLYISKNNKQYTKLGLYNLVLLLLLLVAFSFIFI